MADRSERHLRADAVVVGSGAGGAPVAARLAEAGLDVIVLEAGERFTRADFDGDAGRLLPRLMQARVADDSGLALYAGSGVGGSTLVNDALCWRPPAEILAEWRQRDGLGGLTHDAFQPHVDAVWRDVDASPTDAAHLNRNARRLELGATRLGWRAGAIPRNVRGCANLGLCNLGCPTDAKQSMALSYLPRAERAGARVLSDARVRRVEVEAGQVRAVLVDRVAGPARRARGEPLRIEAPLVCLAAGVLSTPALLLRSGLGGEAAGRGLQLHSSLYVTARFAEPVHGYYGPTMAFGVSEFSDVNGVGGPGFMIENVSVAPVATAGGLPGFGADHERSMRQLPYLARSVVLLRDRSRGRIRCEGDGPARFAYDPARQDLERLRAGLRATARLYLAAGAEEVILPVHGMAPLRSESDLRRLDALALSPRGLAQLYAVHLFGGAAMSGDRSGVCDEEGRCRGTRGLYVVDASSLPGNTGVNPQVTVMANALRIAQGITANGTGR